MKNVRARSVTFRSGLIVAVLALVQPLAVPMHAQVSTRAAPVTGPGVTTIGGIAANARVNLRSGPAILFPVVGTLGYGTRVQKGLCIGGGSAQWCEVKTMDGKISGFVSGQFLVDGTSPTPDDSLAGGPDYWVVRGLSSNQVLGVRLQPKSDAAILATLKNGEIVRNLGCRMTGAERWCKVRSTTGMDVTGWVAGSYLRESAAPPAVKPPAPGGGASGPDFYIVTGLTAGDFLNVRTSASTDGAVIARLAQGAKVRNLGCRMSGTSRWCQIRTTGTVQVTGWVNASYLREG